MANCLLCSKDVTAGYVLCSECAVDVKLSTEPEMLEHFVEWLGAEMANDFAVNPCSMCGREHCNDISHCRSGVTTWLQTKAEKYCQAGPGKRSCGKHNISGQTLRSFPNSSQGEQ